MATVHFLGAAQEVTGSCHLIVSPALGRVLLDCGMPQGRDAVERMADQTFEFDAAAIDAVILSHAHLDHSGLLPKLVSDGFSGPIYCTPATAELLDIMLRDSAGLYLRDLEKENLRRARKGRTPLAPVYAQEHVERALALCAPNDYGQPFAVGEHAQVTFYDAGHILGSAITELRLHEQGATKTLVFSGDLGKQKAVLMNPPQVLRQADVVLMESTYGDRDHRDLLQTVEQLQAILSDAWRRGGNVVIPAFAVGRTQELLFYLAQLFAAGKIDPWQVILDSPMAIAVTQVYDRWLHQRDTLGIKPLSADDKEALRKFLRRLHLSSTVEQSMAINTLRSGAIIIAGSGMCTGGRIRHHLKQRVWDKRNTLIFVGFQAQGTLGRLLVDGVRKVKLFGEEFVVNAEIQTLGGFSAHGGQTELLEWLSHFTPRESGTRPRIVLVHGEPKALDALADKIWQRSGVRALVPNKGDSLVF